MSQVDLFIPTYNRPDYLERILSFYNLYNLDFNIIIADSSSEKNKRLNKKIAASFPKLKILYRDEFSPTTVSHHKFGQMLKYAKAKYTVFCADDDFIIPEGIQQAVDFLEENPDYASAHGSYISFYAHKNLTSKKKFWWMYIYPYRSITSADPLERLRVEPFDCQQVLYALRRTKIVKACYKELLESKVDPILFGERLPEVLTIILGKMKRLPNFYGARQAFSTSYSYWPTERDYIRQGRFDKEFEKFKKSVIKIMQNISNVKKEKISEIVDTNMKIYLSFSSQQYLVARVNLLLSYLPKFVLKMAKALHARYLFSKPKKDLIGLIDNPKSAFFKDFNNVQNIVLKYE